MSRRHAVHLVLALATIVSMSAAPEPQKKAADSKDEPLAVLRQLYADALDRNAALTRKIQQLNQQITMLQSRLVTQEQRTPGVGQIPPDWKSFDFNGSRVYLVPLGSEQKVAARHP